MQKLVLLACAGSVFVGGFSHLSASAEINDDSLVIASSRVDYADIDLATNTGADRFVRRIRHAAQIACGVQYGLRSEAEIAREQNCTRDAMAQAVASVGSTAVAARFERDAYAAIRTD